MVAGDLDVVDRVRQLRAEYGVGARPVAHLLCDRYPRDKVAYTIVEPDRSSSVLTYGRLRDRSERFAAALTKLGVRPGERVATLMGKSADYLVALLGIWRAGAVHVPLFTAFAPAAIALRLNGSAAVAVVCDETQRAKLAPGVDIPAQAPWRIIVAGGSPGPLDLTTLVEENEFAGTAHSMGPDDPLVHIYTSGTTGRPKGVVVPVRALAAFQAYLEFGLDVGTDSVYWCAADPGWAYGLYYGVLGPLALGMSSVLLHAGFSPELTWSVLADHGVTDFAAAPTVYRALRASAGPIPPNLALRRASSAGEPLTPDVNEWAASALGITVHDHYGQTETGMVINNHHDVRLAAPLKPGSMGKPMPGWTVRVLAADRDEPVPTGETGRIVVDLPASPLAWFDGYDGARDSVKFSADGRWYFTGDVGYVDGDGDFHFAARDDDVIIMAGYRIGPFEVESVLATHPAVVESAVVGVPDEVRGEVLEAFVVTREDSVPGLEAELQQWVKDRFAAHAYPRRVHFVGELPKTPSGKIQRFLLRQRRRQELDLTMPVPRS